MTDITPFIAALKNAGFTLADVTAAWNPPPRPPPSTTASFGLNTVGITDPAADPAVHPEIAATMRHFGMQYMRLWMTGGYQSLPAASKWTIPQHYATNGIKPIIVLNFENNGVQGQPPSMADWVGYLNALPPASATGVWAFEIGNEIDYSYYYTGTQAYYVQLLAAAYPILKAKGYQVICGNVLYNLNRYVALASVNAFQFCDYIGGHFYYSNSTDALAAYDKLIAFAATVGKPVLCTEVGLHCSTTNTAGWATLVKQLYTGLKARSGTFLYFMLFTNASKAGPESLLTAGTYKPNQPFYSALEAVLGA